MTIVRVALDVPLRRLFDYAVDTVGDGSAGRRVLVPFGRRQLIGVILGSAPTPEVPAERLKSVIKIYCDVPALPAELLGVFEFCAGYYHHPLGQIVMNGLPPGLRRSQAVKRKTEAVYRLHDSTADPVANSRPIRSAVKRQILAALREAGSLNRAAVVALAPSARGALTDLVASGLVLMEERSFAAVATSTPILPPLLTAEQRTALKAIQLDQYAVWLLHGITGSGKTEIYLRLIEKVLARGKQALVLVPEINLTPQLEEVFRGRFSGVLLASLHSGMAESERVNQYLAAQSGAAGIVLGTRLAVFTPLPALGLIVVDEEHDSSFKQQEGLRYSARDVAIFRAQRLGIPVVLGSATPSLESYHRARSGRYQYLQLTHRAIDAATLPAVHCVAEPMDGGLAQRVLDALGERMARHEQSLVFINRRGYAPVLLCPHCRWVAGCPRCSARLVLHGPKARLHCHHCGLQSSVPDRCPDCGNRDLRPIGRGTQRMELLLGKNFPSARIVRVDRDSTRRKGTLQGFLDRITAQQVDILVGTQMLAKGHNFPQLTLVVVLNADASLYSPDFRAEERLFAQLLQVSGRAGRAAAPGEVLVQTAFPDHPLYAALRNHDYAGFAESQLQLRREHKFPPYTYLAVLRFESAKLGRAAKFAGRVGEIARNLAERVTMFDPVPAPLARLAGKERWQLAAQSASRPALQHFLARLRDALDDMGEREVRWAIDVDPLEL
jgi:primosomal protein N' (replication factor Y) (superfamily II helicase)